LIKGLRKKGFNYAKHIQAIKDKTAPQRRVQSQNEDQGRPQGIIAPPGQGLLETNGQR
jgi:hypothetical protein